MKRVATSAFATEQSNSADLLGREAQKDFVAQEIEGADEPKQLMPGLDSDLEKKLIQLVKDFETESYSTWRYYIRAFLEAELFW